jgi:cytochrome c553
VNQGRLPSVRDNWSRISLGLAAAIAVIAAVIGFAWLPFGQPGERFSGLWDAICSAAGLVQVAPAREQVVLPDHPTTRVAVAPQMLRSVDAESIGRGATLALRCTMCHGAQGMSQAETPNLAAQHPFAIYKQLMDFKTGARSSAVMAPLVADLSDTDMRDLAAYYAYLPRVSDRGASDAAAPPIVADGAPMRSIAPCGACHGELASKPGATWLEGQPAAYLHSQLEAFASGARRNDIGEQMRNVARDMTPGEIDAAVGFYARRP